MKPAVLWTMSYGAPLIELDAAYTFYPYLRAGAE